MTTVFKKHSKTKSLTLYLGKRDYVDSVEAVENVDGVVHVDIDQVEDRKVWVMLTCAFRYGHEDLDVIGLSFRKNIWYKSFLLHPECKEPTLTPLHLTLLKKAGENSYPFTFEIPNNLPCSVQLQPAPNDKGKACGVDYEVKAFFAAVADPNEKISKKNRARLIIRKIQFAPDKVNDGPKVDICRNFMMSDKPVHLEAQLEKDLYYHGETIIIKLKINNETAKTVKKIKVNVDQTADIVLYSADRYGKTILSKEFAETVEANATYETTLEITPCLSDNKEKRGLAVDGQLKDVDTNLASTTLFRTEVEKDVLGILVSYKIKIHLLVAGAGLMGALTAGDVTAELPLVLMHAKPKELDPSTLRFSD